MLRVPAGYYMDALRQEDAELVNNEWPNRHVSSQYLIERQIRLCVSVGLYSTESKELLAWCIR